MKEELNKSELLYEALTEIKKQYMNEVQKINVEEKLNQADYNDCVTRARLNL